MAGLRSPLDDDAEDQASAAAAAKLAERVQKKRGKEPESPKADLKKDQEPGGLPPNGGGQVPDQVGTQVGTSGGTQVARKEEKDQEEQPDKDEEDSPGSSLDFSMRGALADEKDPDQDWVKSGWQAKRFRKAAVDVAVRFKWRGYRSRQELVDAALDAFLPKELVDEARDMARRGEL